VGLVAYDHDLSFETFGPEARGKLPGAVSGADDDDLFAHISNTVRLGARAFSRAKSILTGPGLDTHRPHWRSHAALMHHPCVTPRTIEGMADSRDRDEAGPAGETGSFWEDWFQRQEALTAASAEQWRSLGEGWRDAVDGWWQQAGDRSPPEGRQVLRQAADQGRSFFELADGVARGAGSGEASPGHDILWRLPLEIWEHAARGIAGDGVGSARALRDYQRALADYSTMLNGVGSDTLKEVSETWQARGADAGMDAGLRKLFDLCVDVGEQRYHDLVISEEFAEVGGRLINTLVALVGDSPRPADDEHGEVPDGGGPEESRRGERDTSVDPAEFMARLGIAPDRTVAELRAFAAKLNVALTTLQDIGRIDVGASPREVVSRDGKLTLYRYHPTTGVTNPVPVLIVYALANRPYMMDLEAERSMIRGLLDEGLDVYLVDWGYPDAEDRALDLNDYVEARLGACVQTVCDRHGLDSITLLGVCQGGTFSLCYSALHPDKVRNLVLMVTPVDFHTEDNLLTAWLRHVDVDKMVDTLGNIPGTLLNWAFISMKPLRLTGQKYLDMLDLLDDGDKARTFLRMEKWIHDSPDQAGECFRQFVKDLYQENRLVEGRLRIGDREVDLGQITMPVLNIYATQDHIVPPAATLALEQHIASPDYATCAFEGGHIGIYVSNKAQRQVPDTIARWLHERRDSERESSP
jgi:polyhydroxyalkanoate synthase